MAETPKLKSVANAIRTGIFIERIYNGLSPSHVLTISHEIMVQLEVGKAGQAGCLLVFPILYKILRSIVLQFNHCKHEAEVTYFCFLSKSKYLSYFEALRL